VRCAPAPDRGRMYDTTCPVCPTEGMDAARVCGDGGAVVRRQARARRWGCTVASLFFAPRVCYFFVPARGRRRGTRAAQGGRGPVQPPRLCVRCICSSLFRGGNGSMGRAAPCAPPQCSPAASVARLRRLRRTGQMQGPASCGDPRAPTPPPTPAPRVESVPDIQAWTLTVTLSVAGPGSRRGELFETVLPGRNARAHAESATAINAHAPRPPDRHTYTPTHPHTGQPPFFPLTRRTTMAPRLTLAVAVVALVLLVAGSSSALTTSGGKVNVRCCLFLVFVWGWVRGGERGTAATRASPPHPPHLPDPSRRPPLLTPPPHAPHTHPITPHPPTHTHTPTSTHTPTPPRPTSRASAGSGSTIRTRCCPTCMPATIR